MPSRGLIGFAVVLLLSGCGGEDRVSAPVNGKVTLNGEPMAGVIVRFQPVGGLDASKPEAGMGSFGETNEAGEFSLEFSDNGEQGAVLGEHAVTIGERTPEEEADNDAGGIGQKEPQSRIPNGWADASKRYTVKEGENEPHFELSE